MVSTARTIASEAAAGAPPQITGYEIVREIARGGSGRVFEVRAPGGIAKAAKVVDYDPENPLTDREIEGLRLIRGVRHPYLLSLDRVDVEPNRITLVMELADCNLREVQHEFTSAGSVGIPRERLLPWLIEAAEALDVLNQKYRIHHLDVKPENLFLIAEHIKVGDYGLAREAGRNVIDPDSNAVTPAYAAPELFDSHVSDASDQYSLAVAYMELLTGALPFGTTNLRQLALYHLTRRPDLMALPANERSIIGKALSRESKKRFGSCLEFVEALKNADKAVRPQSDFETIRARASTVRIPESKNIAKQRPASTSPTAALESLRVDPKFSAARCFATDRPTQDVRAAVKFLADGAKAEWFDFGETLVAYRVRDAAGSVLVGVRIFQRAESSSMLFETTITRHGATDDPSAFEARAAAVFASLQGMLAAAPDESVSRREPRAQVQCPVTLFPTNGPLRGVPIPCTAVNTSSRGLGAVSMIPIDADAVRIRPANRTGSFPARVVYCRPSTGGKSFLVGMELGDAAGPDWFASGSSAPHAAGA